MMELVADAIIRHARADNILKPIVVTLNLQCVCNYGFDPIIVAHHLNLVNNAVLTGTSARWAPFGKYLVIVPRDQKMGDCVASTDLDFAVMAPQDHTVRWLHQSHGHAMVRNIDGTTLNWGCLRLGSSAASLVARLVELGIRIHTISWLIKGLTKLLEVFINRIIKMK